MLLTDETMCHCRMKLYVKGVLDPTIFFTGIPVSSTGMTLEWHGNDIEMVRDDMVMTLERH